MGRNLSMVDFYEIISSKSNISHKNIKKIWLNCMKLIISEIQNNNQIQLNGLGTFTAVRKGGTDEDWFNKELGIMTRRYVQPYNFVEFKPNESFINAINSGVIDLYKEKRFSSSSTTETEVEEDEILSEMQTDPSLEEKVLDLLHRKKKRRIKEKDREKLYQQGKNLGRGDKVKPKPLRVWDKSGTMREYPSIYNCAIQLKIRPIKLSQQLKLGKMEVEGYKFEFIKEAKTDETKI